MERDRNDLIARYSYQPYGLLKGMIMLREPVEQTTFRRDSASSHLGRLDELPVEILYFVLGLLDLRSISHLSEASLRGHVVVRSFHIYRDLLKYASHPLTVLGRTRCIRHHSATTLHTALFSQDCVSCGHFGAFLFLPTFERCCYECLSKNQSLWVAPRALVKKCFDLDGHQIKGLPVLRSLPGLYQIGTQAEISRNRRLNLVSVKSAKALGLKVHGSTTNMPDWASLCRPWGPSTKNLKENNYLRWLQDAPMQPLDGDQFLLPPQPHEPNDKYCGMACIPFPSIGRDGQQESGLWCRGCEWAFENLLYEDEQEIEAALGYSISPDCEVECVLLSLKHRARSKMEFARHIRNCYGVRKLSDEA